MHTKDAGLPFLGAHLNVRPCFLVVDREFAGSISTRKLVIETAKFNVITAYSFQEADAVLERFPKVHGVVVSSSPHAPCAEFFAEIRTRYPEMKLIATGFAGPGGYGPVDLVIEGYRPASLLDGLRALFPEEAATVLRHEADLEHH